jgi:hypothetical protein
VQGGAQLDHAFDVDRAWVCLGVPHADGNDDRLARSDDMLVTVDGEVGLAGDDREAFLLVRMYVLGDRPAGSTGPVEANDVVAVLSSRCELDPLARGRVRKWAELDGYRRILLPHLEPAADVTRRSDRAVTISSL